MRSTSLTAAFAVLSIPVLAALAAVALTNPVWANDIPGTIESRQLPRKAVEQPDEGALSDTRIPVSEDEAAVNAQTLTGLVAIHSGTDLVDRDAECLASAIYFESKGESLDGQLAVAKTILNRTRSGRFPASVCGVVFQPGQFSFVRAKGFPPIARTSRQWQTAQAIAHIATHDLWEGPVEDALFFHARRVNPRWRMQRIAAVGNHVFYR
ncbi:MAG: cell wall hydrolase [Chakrabartia sp.]